MGNLKAINLKPPVDFVILFLRLDPDGWRFNSWKGAVEHSIPEEPPPTTLGRAFPYPELAADYFTKVLTDPKNTVPPERPLVPGRMPPGPDVDYYWPPSFETCIKNYEQDLARLRTKQIQIDRVIILGAGFSNDFRFFTSRLIVKGVADYFGRWRPSDWFENVYRHFIWYLDKMYPRWQVDPPTLNEFLESFLPRKWLTKSYSRKNDPLSLYRRKSCYEFGNCFALNNHPFSNTAREAYDGLRAFQALLGVYLTFGLNTGEVVLPWAIDLFKEIQPSDVILTFNWDVIPEVLMMMNHTPFCRYDWTKDRTKLVKLHGSVDLMGQPNIVMKCDVQVLPERFEMITPELWRARTPSGALVHANQGMFGRPMPPSERYNKSPVIIMPPYDPLGYGYQLIQFNWRKARTALKRTREVHVIGYSFSEEDEPFRKMVHATVPLWSPEVTVDVWNPNPTVEERARELFGAKRVDYHQQKASEFRFR